MMKAMMPSANVLDDRRGSGLPVASTKTATQWAMMRRIRYATPITRDGTLDRRNRRGDQVSSAPCFNHNPLGSQLDGSLQECPVHPHAVPYQVHPRPQLRGTDVFSLNVLNILDDPVPPDDPDGTNTRRLKARNAHRVRLRHVSCVMQLTVHAHDATHPSEEA